MAFGSWQLGQAGANDGISCQSVVEPMKSLCRGENASVSFRSLSLFPYHLPPFIPLVLSHPLLPRFDIVSSRVEEEIINGNSMGIRKYARRIAR